MRHEHDITKFNVPSVVLIRIDTGDLYLIDKVTFYLGSPDEGSPINEELVAAAGFEILGEL